VDLNFNMIKTRKYTRNDVNFITVESTDEVESALTTDGNKFVLKGIPAIQIMDNSYKYGDQIQITVYNKIGSVIEQPRIPYAKNYDRIEIFINRETFRNLIREYIIEDNKRTLLQYNSPNL